MSTEESVVYLGDSYFPYSVALELTLSCNMKCRHCGSTATQKNRENFLDYQEWMKVIDDLNKLNASIITFSGGEPFLYPRWRDLLKYAKDLNNKLKICIISNGSLINEEDIVYMKKHGLTKLAVSLDGDETIHDDIRRFSGAYLKILSVIEMCNNYKLPLCIATSFNQYNFSIRKKILDILIDKGVKLWQVQIVNSFGRAGKDKANMLISKEQYVQLIDDVWKWKKEYGDKIQINAADSMGYCYGKAEEILDGAEWDGCSAGCFSLGIEANGNVKGCLSLQDDHFISGNIRERSLIDIWNDDKSFPYTRDYDSSKMIGECKNCSKNKTCKAGCLGMAYSLGQTIYENQYCYRNILGKANVY